MFCKSAFFIQNLRSGLIVLACVLSLSFPPLSGAREESEIDDLMEMSIEELLNVNVITVSRKNETANRAPGTIMVITRDQIVERGYTSLTQVLRDLPGFDVQYASDSVYHTRYAIRGVFGNNKFLILQNGIRISSPTGEEIPIADNFPLYNVKQIEVLYGPTSALYGADAFTGVINLITYSGAKAPKEIRLDIGENEYGRVHFSGGHQFGKNTELTIAGHFHDTDNVDLGKEFPEKYELNDLVTFGGTTFLDADDRKGPDLSSQSHSVNLKLDVNNFTLAYNRSFFEHSTATAVKPDYFDYGQNPFWETSIDTVYAMGKLPINDIVNTDVQVSYSRYKVDESTKFTNIFVDFVPGYKYAHGSEFELNQQFIIKPNDMNEVIVGYSAEWFDSTPLTADLPKKFDPDLPASSQELFFPGTNNEIAIPVFDVEWQNYAGYVQIQTDWTESLSTTAGLRFDNSTAYKDTFNPRLGLVWLPQDKTTVKFLYGEAFLAPSPFNMYRFYGSFAFLRDDGLYQSFFFNLPNPDLKPEEMKTYEINLSHRFTDHLNLQLTGYYEEVDELIQPVLTQGVDSTFITGGVIQDVQMNQNVGALEAIGFDLSFIYQKTFHIHKLKLWGSYSYVEGDFDQPGRTVELPFTAKNKLKIGGTYRYRHFFISPTYYWIGESTLSEQGDYIGVTSPSYTLVNLYAGFEDLIDGLELHVRVNNLFNKRYGEPGLGDFTVFDSVPQNTRWFQAGVTYRF